MVNFTGTVEIWAAAQGVRSSCVWVGQGANKGGRVVVAVQLAGVASSDVPGDLESEAIKFPTHIAAGAVRSASSSIEMPTRFKAFDTVTAPCTAGETSQSVRYGIRAQTPFQRLPLRAENLASPGTNQSEDVTPSGDTFTHDDPGLLTRAISDIICAEISGNGRAGSKCPLPVGGCKPIFWGGRLGG